MYYYKYKTPQGFDDMIMLSDDEALTGLYFEGAKYLSTDGCEEKLTPVLKDTAEWLDIYFAGRDPGFTPEYKIIGSTPFRDQVIKIMAGISFGKIMSYGDIAEKIAAERGIEKMSAQAVGGAVGRNPISIIIPCHRVTGSDGSLTGYAGGIKNKEALLLNEGIKIKDNFIIE